MTPAPTQRCKLLVHVRAWLWKCIYIYICVIVYIYMHHTCVCIQYIYTLHKYRYIYIYIHMHVCVSMSLYVCVMYMYVYVHMDICACVCQIFVRILLVRWYCVGACMWYVHWLGPVLAGRKPPTAHLTPQEHECKADNWWQCHRLSKKTGWSQLAAEEQTVLTLDVDDKSQMQLQGSYHILSLLWHVVTIIVTILLRILWFGMSVETSQLVATQRPPAYIRMWCDAMITSQIGGKEALSSWHWRY